MKRLIVKIKKDDRAEPQLFEVPGDQQSMYLVSNLVKALGLLTRDANGIDKYYWLETESGQLMTDTQTLTEAGVTNGMLLLVKSGASRPPKLASQASVEKTGGMKNSKPERSAGERVKTEPPQTWKKIR